MKERERKNDFKTQSHLMSREGGFKGGGIQGAGGGTDSFHERPSKVWSQLIVGSA